MYVSMGQAHSKENNLLARLNSGLFLAPWVATTAAWPVPAPAPVARGPTRTAQPMLLALGRYRTQKIRVME